MWAWVVVELVSPSQGQSQLPYAHAIKVSSSLLVVKSGAISPECRCQPSWGWSQLFLLQHPVGGRACYPRASEGQGLPNMTLWFYHTWLPWFLWATDVNTDPATVGSQTQTVGSNGRLCDTLRLLMPSGWKKRYWRDRNDGEVKRVLLFCFFEFFVFLLFVCMFVLIWFGMGFFIGWSLLGEERIWRDWKMSRIGVHDVKFPKIQ